MHSAVKCIIGDYLYNLEIRKDFLNKAAKLATKKENIKIGLIFVNQKIPLRG